MLSAFINTILHEDSVQYGNMNLNDAQLFMTVCIDKRGAKDYSKVALSTAAGCSLALAHAIGGSWRKACLIRLSQLLRISLK
jgi:hypothetical protein